MLRLFVQLEMRLKCPTNTCDQSACIADGIKLALAERTGVFRLAQYGPINSLSIRRNEIMLAVQL